MIQIYIEGKSFSTEWSDYLSRLSWYSLGGVYTASMASKDAIDFGFMHITNNINAFICSMGSDIDYTISRNNNRIHLECIFEEIILRDMWPLESPKITCYFEHTNEIYLENEKWNKLKRSISHYLIDDPSIFLFPVQINY